MTGRASMGVVVGAVVGIGVAAAVLHARESAFPLPPVTERMLYLQSGKTADRLMLDFDALASDVYWIRSIQSYGRDLKNRNRPDRFGQVAPLLDLTTTLDPHFLIAYQFGAVFLAFDPPNGPGRADQAIKLLEKGLAANPNSWQLAHDIAFVHYFHTHDYMAAADWFDRAAALPRAPEWIAPLAAMTKAQGGNRKGARQMLAELSNSPEGYIRKMALRSLEQLDAMDAIDVLEALTDRYRQLHERFPGSWQDLIADRALTGVPADKYGAPFELDPVTGRVSLSSKSPLSPLPEMLRRDR